MFGLVMEESQNGVLTVFPTDACGRAAGYRNPDGQSSLCAAGAAPPLKERPTRTALHKRA